MRSSLAAAAFAALFACFISAVQAEPGRLAAAVMAGDLPAVRSALDAGGDANAPDPELGQPPLHIAVSAGSSRDPDVAQLLVSRGARIDELDPKTGMTPLMAAMVVTEQGPFASLAKTQSAALVERLLKAGADANRATRTGETPVMLAVTLDNLPALRVLLSKGADPNRRNAQQETALQAARSLGRSPQMVDALVAAGATAPASVPAPAAANVAEAPKTELPAAPESAPAAQPPKSNLTNWLIGGAAVAATVIGAALIAQHVNDQKKKKREAADAANRPAPPAPAPAPVAAAPATPVAPTAPPVAAVPAAPAKPDAPKPVAAPAPTPTPPAPAPVASPAPAPSGIVIEDVTLVHEAIAGQPIALRVRLWNRSNQVISTTFRAVDSSSSAQSAIPLRLEANQNMEFNYTAPARPAGPARWSLMLGTTEARAFTTQVVAASTPAAPVKPVASAPATPPPPTAAPAPRPIAPQPAPQVSIQPVKTEAPKPVVALTPAAPSPPPAAPAPRGIVIDDVKLDAAAQAGQPLSLRVYLRNVGDQVDGTTLKVVDNSNADEKVMPLRFSPQQRMEAQFTLPARAAGYASWSLTLSTGDAPRRVFSTQVAAAPAAPAPAPAPVAAPAPAAVAASAPAPLQAARPTPSAYREVVVDAIQLITDAPQAGKPVLLRVSLRNASYYQLDHVTLKVTDGLSFSTSTTQSLRLAPLQALTSDVTLPARSFGGPARWIATTTPGDPTPPGGTSSNGITRVVIDWSPGTPRAAARARRDARRCARTGNARRGHAGSRARGAGAHCAPPHDEHRLPSRCTDVDTLQQQLRPRLSAGGHHTTRSGASDDHALRALRCHRVELRTGTRFAARDDDTDEHAPPDHDAGREHASRQHRARSEPAQDLRPGRKPVRLPDLQGTGHGDPQPVHRADHRLLVLAQREGRALRRQARVGDRPVLPADGEPQAERNQRAQLHEGRPLRRLHRVHQQLGLRRHAQALQGRSRGELRLPVRRQAIAWQRTIGFSPRPLAGMIITQGARHEPHSIAHGRPAPHP